MSERNPESIVCSTPLIILLSLEGLLSGTHFPEEEDFLNLADKLQESPLSGLSPEALSLVDEILRGKPPI